MAESVNILQSQLSTMFTGNIFILIPVILILVGSLFKWPTIPTMLGNSFLALFLAQFHKILRLWMDLYL